VAAITSWDGQVAAAIVALLTATAETIEVAGNARQPSLILICAGLHNALPSGIP